MREIILYGLVTRYGPQSAQVIKSAIFEYCNFERRVIFNGRSCNNSQCSVTCLARFLTFPTL